MIEGEREKEGEAVQYGGSLSIRLSICLGGRLAIFRWMDGIDRERLIDREKERDKLARKKRKQEIR